MKMLAMALVFIASNASAAQVVYEGAVSRIIDGDTFEIEVNSKQVRIRLCGVDSPERGHQGAPEATSKLDELISGKTVRCIQVGSGTPCDGRSPRKSRKRVVAQCFDGDLDIATAMVCSGNAVDWPKFSGGYYDASKCTAAK